MLKQLKHDLSTYKTITVILLILLILSWIPIGIGAYYVEWMQTQPFEYNDYAVTRSWLPQITEPQLMFYRYDGIKPNQVYLDSRKDQRYIVYYEEDNCWSYDGGCAEDHIQLRNNTQFTWRVLMTGNPTINLMGDCPIKEIREDEILYSMPPDCYFLLFPPKDDSLVTIITNFGE